MKTKKQPTREQEQYAERRLKCPWCNEYINLSKIMQEAHNNGKAQTLAEKGLVKLDDVMKIIDELDINKILNSEDLREFMNQDYSEEELIIIVLEELKAKLQDKTAQVIK